MLLKFTNKVDTKGVKHAIANGNQYGITDTTRLAGKHPSNAAVCTILKNNTNYYQVAEQLWLLSKEEVQQELIGFYGAVAKEDPSLLEACKFGLKRHMDGYSANHMISLKNVASRKRQQERKQEVQQAMSNAKASSVTMVRKILERKSRRVTV